MRNRKQSAVLATAGLMGVGALLGSAHLASAQPSKPVRKARQEVRESRQDLREERQERRAADTPAERREERRDVREARRDLRQDQAALQRRQAQQQWRRNGGYVPPRYNNGRPVYGNPGFGRPGYVPPRYNNGRPNWNNRPGWNNGRTYQTYNGVVINDLGGNAFTVRADNGRTFVVRTQGGEPRNISRGDRVRVQGYLFNNQFTAQDVDIIRNR